MNLADRIAHLRKARSYTQEEFADKINVGESTLAAFERGTRKPSPDVLINMSRVLGLSIDEIVDNKRERA